MTQADDWSDYWRKEGAEGEVFVDPTGGKHPELEAHWRGVFADLDGAHTIVDIACGGGSIFTAVAADASHELHGVDISDEALKVCAERHPSATLHVGSAEELPLGEASMDLAVSQFGIEYSPDKLKAFSQAANCLRAGGRLDCLCHHQEGQIDQKIAPAYKGTQAALETNFAGNAITLVQTKQSGNQSAYVAARSLFIDSERKMVDAMREAKNGIHIHLYGGFKQMFSNYDNYDPDEIVQWLSDMRDEITRANARYGQMAQAALSQQQVDDIQASLKEAGCKDVSAEPFFTSSSDLPIAWRIRATR